MGIRRLVFWSPFSSLLSLVTVVVVGLAVRLPYFSERSIWFDEAASWRTASFPLPEMLQRVRANVHTPLYYLLLKLWMMLFGDSPAALRSLSLLFGAATIVGMYLFGRELYVASGLNEAAKEGMEAPKSGRHQHWFALLVASLVALSPFQIDASLAIKMYSLGTALAAFSSWLLLRALRRESTSSLWGFFALTVLAFLYTHHYALLTVAAQIACLGLLVGWRALRGRAGEVLRPLRGLIMPGVLVAVAYLPWALVLTEQAARVKAEYWTEELSWDLMRATIGKFVLPAYDSWSDQELQAILAVVCVLLATAWRPRPGNVLVLASAVLPLVLAAVISVLYAPIWEPRYFRFAQLFFLASTAIAIWRIRTECLRGLVGGLVIIISAGLMIDFWRERDVPRRPGMRGVIERIRAENQDGAPIIVVWSVHYFPARYYAPQSVDVRMLFPESPIPHYLGGPIAVSEDLISAQELQARMGPGVWIISPTDLAQGVPGVESCEVSRKFVMEYDRRTHSPIYAAFYRKAKG